MNSTIEQQRIICAEACGWKPKAITKQFQQSPTDWEIYTVGYTQPPPCHTSLDAMHEARRSLNQAQIVTYLNTLRSILSAKFKRAISDYDLLNAEPSEHLEAFCRTVKPEAFK